MFGLFSGLFRRRRSNLFGGGRSKKKKPVSVTKKRKAKGISQKIVSDSAAGKRKANVLNDGNANGQVVTLDGKPLESFKIPDLKEELKQRGLSMSGKYVLKNYNNSYFLYREIGF